jgi:hypothetical protein
MFKRSFNHMPMDPGQHRLFAAAPTNGTVEIVDLKAGKALRSLKGERPAAVRFAPERSESWLPPAAAHGRVRYRFR